MRNIWFVSDTHFNHDNILMFSDLSGKPVRTFNSVEDMNETMIDNWNSRVVAGDKVYHLGDVFFGSKEKFRSLWPRLNGQKRLVVGNHDDIKYLAKGGFFSKLHMWRLFKEHGFVCTHVPIKEENFGKAKLNLHGHTHERGSPEGPYLSCCEEMTNYKPLHIDEIKL